MKKIIDVFLLAIFIHMFFLLSPIALCQDTIIINRQKFIKQDSAWYIKDSGDLFKVDESVVTVKWKAEKSPVDVDTFLTNNLRGAEVIRKNILGFVDIRIPRAGNFIQMLQRFTNSDFVEIAEANSFGQWGSIIPPPKYANDPLRTNQWYLNQTNDIDIDINEAWGYSTGSSSVIAAVIDNGIDWRHEDIGRGTDSYENVWLNPGEDPWSNPNDPTTGNGIDNDGNGLVDDWKGWNFYTGTNNSRGDDGSLSHGTAIAGIISAKTNNNKGISGVAGGWNNIGTNLLSVVAGVDAPLTALVDDAILYAVNKNAKIINMSMRVSPTAAINAALEYAYNNGHVLIACAGNRTGPTPCDVWYPANHPYVIAVAGIKKDGTPYPSCSTPASDSLVNISSLAGRDPAYDPIDFALYSTLRNNTYGLVLGHGGTSYAAPQAVGVAALLLSIRPTLTPQQIRCILERTADDMGTTGYDQIFGWGRLNANRALQATTIILISPPNNSIGSNPQTLSWTQLYGASSYWVQVATNSNFTNPVFDEDGITSTSVTTGCLTNNVVYYWRVRADNDLCNATAWSETWRFTASGNCQPPPPPDPRNAVYQQDERNPISFGLLQNYPNPFNPLTIVNYQLPIDTWVTLKVYNMLGQEVAMLVNEVKEPGVYTVQWDASGLPSGVYYYKVHATNFLDVKKMIIAK